MPKLQQPFETGIYDKGRMIVPVQIRSDLTARLQIPTDLTEAEADKIARVVRAYARSEHHGSN